MISTLEEKDRKNREEALCKVIDDAKKLIRDYVIPPTEISPFEEELMYYVLLSHLDKKHYEFFGLIEEQIISEDDKLNLYSSLSDEQKNVLKRDFLIKNMINTSGINKKSALLIELVKYHFPDDLDGIEHTHNEEYLKKRQVIQEQIDKINSKTDDLKDVA